MEPDLDALFRPKRFRLLPVLVILGLCAFGLWLMNLGPKTPPPRKFPAPPKAAAPAKAAPAGLYVTLMPPPGWCCLEGGKLLETNRTTCETDKGVFFETEERAKAGCRPTAKSGSPKGRGTGA